MCAMEHFFKESLAGLPSPTFSMTALLYTLMRTDRQKCTSNKYSAWLTALKLQQVMLDLPLLKPLVFPHLRAAGSRAIPSSPSFDITLVTPHQGCLQALARLGWCVLLPAGRRRQLRRRPFKLHGKDLGVERYPLVRCQQ